MKKLIYLIGIILIISCGSGIKNVVSEKQMYFAIDTIYSTNQFDSICMLETIPEWSSTICFKDQNGKAVNEQFYMKQDGTVYRAIKVSQDSVKFLKRVIK